MRNCTAEMLLSWYDEHRRNLPWRDVNDPYKTWISEIMLQQTRVETVIPYYKRFVAAFPDVRALASAELDEVLKLWEGLGYYSRARNLHQGARQIEASFGGELPRDVDALRRIAGIGRYTAGAIASMAYGICTPAVDGNVIRVVSRLRGIRENVGIPSVRRALEAEAAALVPQERPGDFNQALMDLGAAICIPGTPECAVCPLSTICSAYAAEDADALPVLPVKTPPRTMNYAVLLIISGRRILMRKRTESLLHGLWAYPMAEADDEGGITLQAAEKLLRQPVDQLREIGEARHVFTHQIWQMKLYAAAVPEEVAAPRGMRFVTADEMRMLAIPSAMAAAKKAAESLLCSK